MNICETNNTEFKYVYELQFTTINLSIDYNLIVTICTNYNDICMIHQSKERAQLITLRSFLFGPEM